MELFLSLVIPAFNEEKRIVPTLRKVLDYLSSQSYASEVIVVNDGSTDATPRLVRELALADDRLQLVEEAHRGKGHAVKVGMLQASGAYRFLCDADLAMPIQEVARFLPPSLEGTDVAIGSREAPGAARYGEPAYRHAMGRVFNLVVRVVVGLAGIRDSQAGFKCFTAQAALHLFPQQRLDGFGFDVEILSVAQRSGLSMREVPINWYYQQESKVRPVRDTLRMLGDAVRVRWGFATRRYRLDPGSHPDQSQRSA